MSNRSEQSYAPPLSVSAITGLIVLSMGLSLLFAGNSFLQWLGEGTGSFLLVLVAVLVAVAVLETVALVGLRRLKPWAWYAGIGVLGVATVASLFVFVLQLSLLAGSYVLVNVLTAVFVYHKRPIYTPGTRARYDAYYSESVLAQFAVVREMRDTEATPIGVKVLFVVGTLASVVAFVQGVRLIWTTSGVPTVLGLFVVAVAALQTYTLYGLWILERWAWFASLLLFGIATVFAAFRILLFPDPLAVVEFVLNGLIVAYIVHRKPLYAPKVTVDLTPR
jgi:uncharacterized membrane protein (DUF2068 family)